MNTTETHHLLGLFIRTHRERLSPPRHSAGRRRTPGLRREELAEAAGVSTTWITWIEQGRNVTASPLTLARLAHALQLNPAERASLFDLAGKRDPAPPDELNPLLPSEILDLPSCITVPAYLLDPAWTACAWNNAAALLFTGWLDENTTERNLLRYAFLSPHAQELIHDWKERVHRLTAELRADYSRHPYNAAIQSLIDELSARSPLFAGYWREQTVLHREGGTRQFNHKTYGIKRFLQTTLLVASHQEYKLVCLTPLEE